MDVIFKQVKGEIKDQSEVIRQCVGHRRSIWASNTLNPTGLFCE